MAFGDLKGTLTASVNSVTNPTVASGSVAVAVGDLVFVTMSQQTNLTAANTVTDNLGNTYVDVNAGTDAGTVSIRSFYARVTVAGTLTTVNVPAGASTNDASIVADVIEGPFTASPLDANPANTTDATTPFDCPPTGTLAQADEVVMAAIAVAANQTVAATAPSTLAGTVARANASVGQSRRVVSATTTITPQFTGTSATAAQVTASFKKAPSTAHQGESRLDGSGLLSVGMSNFKFAEARFGSHGTRFDPVFLWSQARLSNDELTVTAVPTATTGTSTRTKIGFSEGKYYCEFTANVNDNNSGFGLCNASQTTGQSLGATLNAVGYFANGTVRINGSTVSTIDTYAAGDHIGMAVDFNADLIWFRVGTGDWNASGAANPVTGAGGISLSSLNAGPYFVAVECRSNGTNDSFTALFEPEAAYAGPGDVVGSAVAWWGLRAYSEALVGTNAVRLREDGGNTEQDFATIAGGGLDLAAIATFKGANNLFVVTLYDQTGNGNNVTQATAALQPPFTLSGLGSRPIITWDDSRLGCLVGPLALIPSQPFTLSTVSKCDGSLAAQQGLMSDQSNIEFGFRRSAANDCFMYAGSAVPTASQTDASWHSFNIVWNNASSDLNVDGGVNIVDITSTSGMTGVVTFGAYGASVQPVRGASVEFGMWASAFTGTQSANMSANQHAYWGF